MLNVELLDIPLTSTNLAYGVCPSLTRRRFNLRVGLVTIEASLGTMRGDNSLIRAVVAERRETLMANRMLIFEGCIAFMVSIACSAIVLPFLENCNVCLPEHKVPVLTRVTSPTTMSHLAKHCTTSTTRRSGLGFRNPAHGTCSIRDSDIARSIVMNIDVTEHAHSYASFQPTVVSTKFG